MKLLELLVNARIEWHPEALCYTQDKSGYCGPYKITNPKFQDNGLWSSKDMVVGASTTLCALADDWQTAIVTKEQYDNACKLVDDGYTLWFGGECPVQGDAMLEMALIHNGAVGGLKPVKASDFQWTGSPDLIAYKVINSKPDGSDEELSVVYEPDVVNRPSHYTNGKVECIDAIESATVGKTGIEAVCVANVIKYLWRYEDKNGLEDIKKAQWYLNKLIEVKK